MFGFDLLTDVKVLDLTTRLPGPMSSMILNSLGATVDKVENSDIGSDPFNSEDYLKHAPHFKDWYQKLNKKKDIFQISFKDNKKFLIQKIQEANIVLIPDGNYFNSLLKEVPPQNCAIIKLSGGKNEWKSLHDLNALALTDMFKYHCNDSDMPPYLPFAGISYAHYLATLAIALLRKVEKSGKTNSQTVYLKDVSEFIFNSLATSKTHENGKFLHNGSFPCYQIYKTLDSKKVCLAAVEEKYWINLNQAFNLELNSSDRFDTSGKTLNYLKNIFSKLHSGEINKQIKKAQLCLTIVLD